MLPILVELGPFRVPTHDAFTVAGLLVGLVIYYRALDRQGLLERQILVLSLAALFGGAIGARLITAWEHLDYYRLLGEAPLSYVIEHSGKSLIGAIAGGYLAVTLGKRLLHFRRSTGDSYALAIPVATAVGRVGCFFSELPLGTPTDLPWGVRVPPTVAAAFPYCPGCDRPMHPSMLYEIAFCLVAAVLIVRFGRRVPVQGDLLKLYLLAAGTFRFLVLLVDLTEDCNLACPTCFRGARPGRDRYVRTADVLRSLDAAIEREGGRVDLVMLSGGEPTIHPALGELLRETIARPVTRVVLNTNGLRVARDDALLAELASLRDGLEVYLQFDGLSEAAHRRHRGADLRVTKEAALSRLTSARIFTTLAATLELGVNDGEIGAIVDLALATDHVGGVALQPLFGPTVAGPLHRLTTTGTLHRQGEQTAGRVGPDDFIGLPCSHPDCSAISYLVRTDDGAWRSVPKLVGVERLREHLGLVGNRLVPDDAMWQALSGLLSETMLVSRPEFVEHLATLSDVCALGLSGFVRTLGRFALGRERLLEAAALRVKRLSVKSFMDPWTLNVERLKQCCIHVASTDPGAPVVRIPFCARQAFGVLRERTAAGMVGRAAVARSAR